MDALAYDALQELRAAKRQQIADHERQAEHLFFRAMTMLTRIDEKMINEDRAAAMTRANVARACFEGASYAKREAQALRNALSAE